MDDFFVDIRFSILLLVLESINACLDVQRTKVSFLTLFSGNKLVLSKAYLRRKQLLV